VHLVTCGNFRSADKDGAHTIQSAVAVKSVLNYTQTLYLYHKLGHSVKHRKLANFDPSESRNSSTNFDETWHGYYVRDSTSHDNFGWGSST